MKNIRKLFLASATCLALQAILVEDQVHAQQSQTTTEETAANSSQETQAKESTSGQQAQESKTKEQTQENSPEVRVSRIKGDNRYKNAVEISSNSFSRASRAYLANGHTPTDALAGAPLAANDAGGKGIPILLTKDNEVVQPVLDELKRLQTNEVVILGGKNSIKPEVVSQLEKIKVNVTLADGSTEERPMKVSRIAGDNRYQQAANVAKTMIQNNPNQLPNEAFLVSGETYADALSISSVATMKNAPILLTNSKYLNPNVKPFISKIKKWTLVGGTQSISQAVQKEMEALGASVQRIDGKNRYEISRNILEKYNTGKNKNKIIVVNGNAYADALPASVYGKLNNRHILLVNNNYENLKRSCDFIIKHGIDDIILIGGENTLTKKTAKDLAYPSKFVKSYIKNKKVKYFNQNKDALLDALIERYNTEKGYQLNRYIPSDKDLKYTGIENLLKHYKTENIKHPVRSIFFNHLNHYVDNQLTKIGVNDQKYYPILAVYAGLIDQESKEEGLLIFALHNNQPIILSTKQTDFKQADNKKWDVYFQTGQHPDLEKQFAALIN